jgi:hypothetical protein
MKNKMIKVELKIKTINKMKKTINLYEFREGFRIRERKNFSYEGLEALYNYLEEYEEETGEAVEFDPIALCCEFSEYENLKELQENYSDIETMEDLRNNTQVIEIPGSDRFIIQDY